MKRVVVNYENASLIDVVDLVKRYSGYFDGDRRAVIFPHHEELVEELENRGIRFKTEVVM